MKFAVTIVWMLFSTMMVGVFSYPFGTWGDMTFSRGRSRNDVDRASLSGIDLRSSG